MLKLKKKKKMKHEPLSLKKLIIIIRLFKRIKQKKNTEIYEALS
jgi:hypothetical protein